MIEMLHILMDPAEGKTTYTAPAERLLSLLEKQALPWEP
jgi:hypothetical protein